MPVVRKVSEQLVNKDLQTTLKSGQARDHILAWIRENGLSAGSKLPSERHFADVMEMNQRTVRRGINDLVEAGVVVKRPRVGSFLKSISPVEMATSVAVLLPKWMIQGDGVHPVVGGVLKGVHEVLDHGTYSVAHSYYHKDNFWLDTGQVLVERGIRGVLLYVGSWSNELLDGVRKLRDAGIKIVFLDRDMRLDCLGLPSVSVDPISSRWQLFEGLLERGHRRIVFVDYLRERTLSVFDETAQRVARLCGDGDPRDFVLRILDYRLVAGEPHTQV